jgi:hypothetical protein
MLSPTTCVGFRYGRCAPVVSAAFPGGTSSGLSARPKGLAVLSPPRGGFNAVFRLGAPPSLPRPRLTARTGTGIFARFPSESPFGLSLGPGSP